MIDYLIYTFNYCPQPLRVSTRTAFVILNQASVLTINSKDEFKRLGEQLMGDLRENQIDFKSDLGGNLIGKKYSIMDEIGVNYSIVVDHDSIRHSPRNRVGNLTVV